MNYLLPFLKNCCVTYPIFHEYAHEVADISNGGIVSFEPVMQFRPQRFAKV